MAKFRRLLIQSVPEGIDETSVLESISNEPVILHHDLLSGETLILTESPRIEGALSSIGVSTREIHGKSESEKEFVYLQIMAKEEPKPRDQDTEKERLGIYQLFHHKTAVFSFFIPTDNEYSNELKNEVEERISRIEVRSTRAIGNILGFGNRDSVHNELYYASGQRKLLSSILDNVNDAILSRGISYRVGVAIERDTGSDDIITYIKSSAIVLSERKIRAKDTESLYGIVKREEGVPLPYKNSSRLLWLSNKIRRNKLLNTSKPRTSGQIDIGRYVDAGIGETGERISVDARMFNLGTLITGVPGTGKTMTAKRILSQFPKHGTQSVVIISPTAEWNAFGVMAGMSVIDLSDENARINLFKCEGSSPQKFYEDLAMLIASASNAGPYRSSIEKCLLAAFSKVYSKNTDPEPDEVYCEIEEAIIEQHAKRTNTSVKYTKHGENIKSSLENIRLILMKPQFAYSGGMNFRELMRNGAVFDLSSASNSMKPLFYAFILNQVYSIADELDIYGDNEIRSIICIEEAQMIFGGEEESAATTDLKQRIQNFRKKGIGLVLITHNVTDLNASIRRLCQIKLYFRQSPDIAKYAANDMIFNEDDYIKVAGMLKFLGQRVCALSYIESVNGEKVPSGSMFAKVPEMEESAATWAKAARQSRQRDTRITVSPDTARGSRGAEIYYLNEKVFSGTVLELSTIPGLLQGKKYRLVLKGEKKRDDRPFMIVGGEENLIR